MNDIIKEYEEKIEKGYILEDGKPIKCTCGSTSLKSNFFYGDGNNIVEEEKVYCKDCKKLLGIWEYGSWQL